MILGGVGGIAWNGIRHNAPPELKEPEKRLRDAYRSLSIMELRDQSAILKIGGMLQAVGVTPLTFKGRVLSSYYSPTHIRPTGDLDIIVPEQQYSATFATLNESSVACNPEPNGEDYVFAMKPISDGYGLRVDLHANLSRFGMPSTGELFRHSTSAPLSDPSVFRMPCLEHHIRLVTIHFLRHGGWRPLWLCDIAALMDTIDERFRWDLCLGKDPVHAQWVVISMRLAENLLGARSPDYPDPFKELQVPGWLTRTVRNEWKQPDVKRFRRPLFSGVEGFGKRLDEIRMRWPNPLEAVTRYRKSLLSGPVLLYQSRYFLERCWRYVA